MAAELSHTPNQQKWLRIGAVHLPFIELFDDDCLFASESSGKDDDGLLLLKEFAHGGSVCKSNPGGERGRG